MGAIWKESLGRWGSSGRKMFIILSSMSTKDSSIWLRRILSIEIWRFPIFLSIMVCIRLLILVSRRSPSTLSLLSIGPSSRISASDPLSTCPHKATSAISTAPKPMSGHSGSYCTSWWKGKHHATIAGLRWSYGRAWWSRSIMGVFQVMLARSWKIWLFSAWRRIQH